MVANIAQDGQRTKGLSKENISFMEKGCEIQDLEVSITEETYLIYSLQQKTCV